MTADNPPLEVPSLCDRQEIVDTTTRLCMHADFHDWSGLRSCFADDLTVHFPGVTGGESREMAADDFVARWKRYLSRFESTQHLSTNHLVDGDDDSLSDVWKEMCGEWTSPNHLYLPLLVLVIGRDTGIAAICMVCSDILIVPRFSI